MAKEPQIVPPDDAVSMEEMINLVPNASKRSDLFHKAQNWSTVDEQGSMVFFYRAEFLLDLGRSMPFCRENASYINFIMRLARFSAEMFKLWAETEAIPQLSKQVAALQEDLDCLLRLLVEHVPKEFAEPLLEAWKLERRHS